MESLGITMVNALENGFSQNLLYFDGVLEGRNIQVLIDGGSMGDFVATNIVKLLKLKTHTVKNQVLSFANGKQSACNKEIQDVKLVICNYTDNQVNLKVADLPHHDVILGKPWLEKYNPNVDWINNKLTFVKDKQSILIQNALPPKKARFHLISAIQAKQVLRKGKDQFLIAFIKDTWTSETVTHPQAKDLLVEFTDVFPDKLPNKLPQKGRSITVSNWKQTPLHLYHWSTGCHPRSSRYYARSWTI